MPLSYLISERAEEKCELCGQDEELTVFPVPPKEGISPDEVVVLCVKCRSAINADDLSDSNHWRCLNESIWSLVPAVQVLSYRLLKAINVPWAADTLSNAYLEEELLAWAHAEEEKIIHKDVNGNTLHAGDSVTLIQDLNVKGANFTAKRGTAIRRIRLVPDNPEHIEGKVDGQQIVILTKYVKKS